MEHVGVPAAKQAEIWGHMVTSPGHRAGPSVQPQCRRADSTTGSQERQGPPDVRELRKIQVLMEAERVSWSGGTVTENLSRENIPIGDRWRLWAGG